MKMRDLEQATGVNRETIRVYLRHGLLPEPKRSKPNVADYEQAHVDGIRLIRRLHKEEGLTIPQIRRALSGELTDASIGIGAFTHLEQLVAARLDRFDALVPIASILSRNPDAEVDAIGFEKIGAVKVEHREEQTMLSRTDAEIVAIWGEMRAAGFTEANGFNTDLLEFYVSGANELGQTEVRNFLEAIEGKVHIDDAADMALEAINRMMTFFGHLRTKAVLKAFANAAVLPKQSSHERPGKTK